MVIMVTMMISMIRVRVPRTRVAALPTLNFLLVTPHLSDHLRALDQGGHHDAGDCEDKDDDNDCEETDDDNDCNGHEHRKLFFSFKVMLVLL